MKWLAFVVALSAISLRAQYDITGIVTNAQDGEPMVGARVMIAESYSETFTDAMGEFELTNLDQGRHTLVVHYIGFEDYKQEVDVYTNTAVIVRMTTRLIMAPEVVVSATRANEKTPVTYSELNKTEIEKANTAKDLPFLLEQMPSTVVTSDAGTGAGYTSFRIRGSDITRINVTVNGIPLNDAESHGVWWVDLPDIASSTENIQVQRGVGTSTLGAGAFGATVNLRTNSFNRDPYGEVDANYGSFATSKVTARLGSGLVKNRWTFDGRLSRIHSDGFIDRATADLSSWFLSAAYHGRRNLLTVNVFSGHEVTYQAWGGVPEDSLVPNPTFNPFTYENEVDDYRQMHYQFLWSGNFGKGVFLNVATHYTKGAGFFEQFIAEDSGGIEDDLSFYGLDPVIIGSDTIWQTDLVRRRWLDNDFYGAIASLTYDPGQRLRAVVGGGWNSYLGHHYGEVIWARFASNGAIRHRYYDNEATKSDLNVFGKVNYQLTNNVNLFGDLQYRQVDYTFLGFNDSLKPARQTVVHNFVNPKGGLTIDVGSTGTIYMSIAMANREPMRDDYIASTDSSRPDPEQLMDIELGYKLRLRKLALALNGFYMSYTDQLVLTGQVNDVGAYTRRNVASSYRAGGELEWSAKIVEGLMWSGNFTYSVNKIAEFTEFVDDYDSLAQVGIAHENTDIAFSPGAIFGNNISYSPVKGLEFALITKFVSMQFLDNTSNPDRNLDPYLVNDFRINYEFTKWKGISKFKLMAGVYNLFDQVYVSNGYTYSYISGGQTFTENFYYPQAGRHFVLGGGVRF